MSEKQFEVGKTYQIDKGHAMVAGLTAFLTFPETGQFRCHHVDEQGFCWSKDVLYEGHLAHPVQGTCCGRHKQLVQGVFTLVSGEQ